MLVVAAEISKFNNLCSELKLLRISFGFVFIARNRESRTFCVREQQPYKLFSLIGLSWVAGLRCFALVGLILRALCALLALRSKWFLRHSAITFRLLYGKNVDLLTLARNARTSVEMVERFYSSNLSAEMKIAQLQGRQ